MRGGTCGDTALPPTHTPSFSSPHMEVQLSPRAGLKRGPSPLCVQRPPGTALVAGESSCSREGWEHSFHKC